MSATASQRLKQLETENEDAMFVFMSDVWLDQVKVRARDEVNVRSQDEDRHSERE